MIILMVRKNGAVGSLWIDACRIEDPTGYSHKGNQNPCNHKGSVYGFALYEQKYIRSPSNPLGRHPANLVVGPNHKVEQYFAKIYADPSR